MNVIRGAVPPGPLSAQPPGYATLTRKVNAFAAFAVAPLLAIVLTIMAVLSPPAPVLAASAPVRILVLGDSLSAGYGLPAAESFPSRLEAALRARGHEVAVVNAGVSGDTTAGGRSRIAWSLGGTPPPDAAIVALGSNDALRGLEPAETRANLDAILSKFKAAGLPVLLAGMKAPRNFGPDYVREFEAVFPALAKRHDALFYPFILEGVALDPAMNQADGIHPNPKGVARMVEGILPLAEQLIARARAEGSP
jgi:acyl-CoA thioesterase-1